MLKGCCHGFLVIDVSLPLRIDAEILFPYLSEHVRCLKKKKVFNNFRFLFGIYIGWQRVNRELKTTLPTTEGKQIWIATNIFREMLCNMLVHLFVIQVAPSLITRMSVRTQPYKVLTSRQYNLLQFSTSFSYYYSDFEPFDLEGWWGRRLYHTLTQSI